MKIRNLILAGGAFAVLTPVAHMAAAQMDHSMHGQMEMKAPANAKEAYEAVNAKMHKDMSVPLTGDADVDFVRGMTPHHQGAVDMAKVVLQYGKDPELKKLAQDIIKSQEAEIAFMKAWLAKNGK